MSTQIEVNENLIRYLESTGYRSDQIIDKLVAETLSLGGIAQMQIAPEQGQFLEIIVKISKAKSLFGDWTIYRFKFIMHMAKGLATIHGKICSS